MAKATSAIEAAKEHLGGDGGAAEEEHDTAIERMEEAATTFVLNTDTLVDDARDMLLEQIKQRPKPWSATSTAEQRDVAAACEHAAKELVRKVVEAVAASGREPVRALLTKIALGDDIVITAKLKTLGADEEDRAVVSLHGARGKHVLIIPASADDYQGGRQAQTDPDEPGLFEAGDIPDDDSDLNDGASD
jgi:hypothetical protein